jgi:NAD(P)-dependent dehydrogenase (short-subunit alcohol dehydrogenase family)
MTPAGHCLVTGANRGLGLEFVRQLLARGERVVATCRQPGRASALNTLAGEHPGRLRVLPLDVAEPQSHAELVVEWPLLAGEGEAPPRIGLLVNNAGVLHSGERFGSIGLDNLVHSFRTNAAGPLLLTQALAPLLADGARVVNISSRLGSVAETGRFGTPSYALSKAALNMATAQLAQALEPRGIVVVAASPGWVRTDMGGDKAEIAPQDSVAGLLRQVDRLTAGDSGRFLDWQGQALPW